MGGGDLNLKKSWHPSTLRNIERVWKAEQKHEVERQKIEQLQKELAEERAREEIQTYAEDKGVVKKKAERLDWMYQGPAAMANREEYLLGRKIDKTFELLQQQESGSEPKKDDGFDVGTMMFSSQDLSGTATIDLANKIREDPLFSIMKKEKEQKKNLLSNPVKMKQLQQLLQASLMKSKTKKSKKHKKRKHVERESDSEVKKSKKSGKYKSSESEKQEKKTEKRYNSYEEKNQQGRMSGKYDLNYRNYHIQDNKSLHRGDRSETKTHEESCDVLDSHPLSYSKHKSSNSYRARINCRETFSENQQITASDKRKLDITERERRLNEMMENAKWRKEQQQRNKKRYEEEDEKEERLKPVATSDFLRPILSKATVKGSVENRIKQKIYTIQRNSADMDKNFARR